MTDESNLGELPSAPVAHDRSYCVCHFGDPISTESY